jgi:hypothetical protein
MFMMHPPFSICRRLAPLLSGALALLVAGCATAAPVPSTSPAKADKSGNDAGAQSLFDGKTLGAWQVTDFGGGGEVVAEKGQITLNAGAVLTGIHYGKTNELPLTDYEISFETMKIEGSDFFCALTFPVAKSHATLVLGGWGGATTGLSSIDDLDASENDTTKFLNYKSKQWYRLRLRVTPGKIEAWLDDEKIVDMDIADRKVSMRPGEIEMSAPLGIATYQTSAAVRNIKLRRLPDNSKK